MRIENWLGEAILDAVNIGIVFADSDNRVAYINRTAEHQRRIKAPQFIGLDLLSIHSPRLREKIGELLRAFRSGRQASHRNTTKIRGEHLENSYHAVRDKKGDYLGALMVSRALSQ